MEGAANKEKRQKRKEKETKERGGERFWKKERDWDSEKKQEEQERKGSSSDNQEKLGKLRWERIETETGQVISGKKENI